MVNEDGTIVNIISPCVNTITSLYVFFDDKQLELYLRELQIVDKRLHMTSDKGGHILVSDTLCQFVLFSTFCSISLDPSYVSFQSLLCDILATSCFHDIYWNKFCTQFSAFCQD